MNGRRNSDKPHGKAPLPPCRVCGEPGCGFHYGVTTCDACKGFYRRSLIRKEPYICINSQFCHVGSSTKRRQSCPKCRYDKCVAVGMSKRASKVGRYSKLKKSKDLMDVMEYRNSLRNGEIVHRGTVIKTCHTGALKKESSQMTTYSQTSIKDSDKPTEFRIPNESVSVAFSSNSKMRWNLGTPHGKLSHENDDSKSSDKNFNNKSNVYQDKPIDDKYDESLTMTSCFRDMYYGSSSGEMKVRDYTPRFNGSTEPRYTVNEPPQTNVSPSWVDLDTTATSAVLSAGYRSYLDPGNLLAWSPPSVSQHNFGITDRQSLIDLPMDPPSTSMLQSIGHPITDTHNCAKRSFNQVSNLDDQHLKMTNTIESNYGHSLSVISSNTSCKRIRNEHEKDDNPKKECCMQASLAKTEMEPTIVEKKRVFESGQTLSSKPKFLMYVNPNLYNYLFSVFGRFPFKSYEKKSLKSILKNCYKFSDSPIDVSIISNYTSDTYTNKSPESNRALANAPSKEMHSNTCLLRYDQNAMDELFSYLMGSHKHYIKDETRYMSESEITSAQDMFWDLCQFQEMINGKMKFIDDDKYFTILETTGIDYDKRREYLLTFVYPNEEYMIRMITFFNSLPGFDNLTLADKITLTKSCFLDYYFVSRHRGTDTNKDISIDEETNTAYRFSYMRQLFPRLSETQREWDDIINDLKALKLSLEEIIVIKALVATNPDADEMLEQPDIVKQCHQTYRKCLLNLVRKRHGSQADGRFENIVRVLFSSISKIRKVKKYYLDQMTENIFRVLGQETGPLLKEMVSMTTDQNQLEKAM